MTEVKKVRKVKMDKVCSMCKENEVLVSNEVTGKGICFDCTFNIVNELTASMVATAKKMKTLSKSIANKK